MNFLFLDTETTGLQDPRLVSIAFNIHGTNLINHGFYRPPKPIESGASAVNGITNEMVKAQPWFEDTKDKLHIQQLLDQLVLVCHNVKFDARVLQNEGLKVGAMLCTQELSTAVYPSLAKHKLQTLKEDLGLHSPFSRPHSAVGDVMTLKLLFQRICMDKTKELSNSIPRMQAYVSSFITNM